MSADVRELMGSDNESMPAAVAIDTVAVMVTRDGERHVAAQVASIVRQTVRPAAIIVVDDDSRDRTPSILREIARESPIPIEILGVDRSHLTNLRSRVAANVMTGLEAASEFDIAVLADQDDEWLEHRVAAQRSALVAAAGGLLVAGDGLIVDHLGRSLGETLRQAYPLPTGWGDMDAAARMRAALRRPLVTGAASALRVELRSMMAPLPGGWLHDRWATLVAAARDGLILQTESVIRYRLHAEQMEGLSPAGIGVGGRRWRQVLLRGTKPLDAAIRASHVVTRIRPLAISPDIAAELSWGAILRSAFETT